MKKYLFLFLAISLFSCSEDEPATPTCIEDLLSDFQVTADCVGDNLASWDFNGEKVYCFARGVCLSTSVADIYTADCNLLCTLGGANELITCDGIPWQGNATNEQLIWVKEQ
jgi:hypothetical protein